VIILFKKKILLLIIPSIVLIFNALIIFNPSEIMIAARGGAILWFNNVLPSLLPFMIGTNLMLRLGVVNFIGALLEPVMKPLFGVSGRGAFAFAMGAISGYPIGAQVCATLREGEEISQVETQRLLSFVNNSGPLFIIGAVGAGMFGDEQVGYFILTTTLTGSILSGMLFKFYGREKGEKEKNKKIKLTRRVAASRDPFGKILSESIMKSLESLLMIAGFIILFSVLLKILELVGVIITLATLLCTLGVPGGEELISAAIYGFFEITNGASRLAEHGVSKSSVILCAALVSFGGMSIFSQSVAFLSKTDVKPSVFFAAKLLNAAITTVAGFIIYPFWNFGAGEVEQVTPVFAMTSPISTLVLSTIICGMIVLTIFITTLAANIKSAYKKRKNHI